MQPVTENACSILIWACFRNCCTLGIVSYIDSDECKRGGWPCCAGSFCHLSPSRPLDSPLCLLLSFGISDSPLSLVLFVLDWSYAAYATWSSSIVFLFKYLVEYLWAKSVDWAFFFPQHTFEQWSNVTAQFCWWRAAKKVQSCHWVSHFGSPGSRAASTVS